MQYIESELFDNLMFLNLKKKIISFFNVFVKDQYFFVIIFIQIFTYN